MRLETLEVARGHDGLLRGKPEPVLLIGLYKTCGSEPAALLGRLLVRALPKSEIPCCVAITEAELRYDARFAVNERIVALAFAVEEDSGKGVQALYATLETPDQFFLYSALDAEPVPRGLDEWARGDCAAPAAQRVEVLRGSTSVADLAEGDKYLSSAALSVSAQVRSDEVWRLPFLARDERNDWTLVLRMRVGS